MRIDDCDLAVQDKIREVCQKLFHSNYITEYIFSPNESLRKANEDYSFIMQHYTVIEELLDYCGWRLRNDDRAGVLYLSSEYAKAKVILSKIESFFLLALRLLYDENKAKASASGEVFIVARDIVEKLITLNAVEAVTKQEREKSLRTLASKNIITKMKGRWEENDVRLAILPSIVCAISQEKTKAVLEMLSLTAKEANEIDNGEEERL